MTVVEFLQDKYNSCDAKDVTEMLKESKSPISLQTATSILLRGQEKGLIACLSLGVALGCTVDELIWIAKEKGDKVLWRLFVKSDDLSSAESVLINDYRALTVKQQKMIADMIKEMKP